MPVHNVDDLDLRGRRPQSPQRVTTGAGQGLYADDSLRTELLSKQLKHATPVATYIEYRRNFPRGALGAT